MAGIQQGILALAVLLPICVFGQQSQPRIVGTLTSSAPVVIDNVEMQPTAAAAWPVVQGDTIGATSAPALLTTTDHNLITFDSGSKARVKTTEDTQPYIYVQQGGVLFETRTSHVDICIGNRLFVPGAGAKGVLRWEKTDTVSRVIDTGQLVEQGERACDDQVAAPPANQVSSAQPGGAAGGTATAPPPPSSTRSVVAGAIGAASAAIGSALAAFWSVCTGPAGCNHNPLAVSPSTP